MATVGDEGEYEVGRRFVCDGFTGTILYVGKVPPTDGVWLGVEWDDTSRGKHSGDHQGVHYFSCSHEGSGSFVRPKKISLGYTFIEAIQERYGGSGEGGEEREMYVDVKPVELVGTDKITKKQSQYDQLHHANLRGMYVSSAGKEGEIQQTTPSIQVLNLSCNPLLPSWEVVASITRQLPKLTSLDLSENKLLRPPSVPSILMSSLSSLRALYINRMDLKWQQVGCVLDMLPQLEDLHVCQNKISDLRCEDESDSHFPESLQLLNLEENQLSNWPEVMRLQHLSKLKTLILNDNKLSCISLHREERGGSKHLDQTEGNFFPSLQCLSLNNNSIGDWTSLNALNFLPSLTELKFKNNPVTSGELSYMSRQMVIARIGRLTILNSSSVSVRERQLAERQYLKEYAQEWMESQTDESKRLLFNQQHPRFANLVKEQGLPEDALVAQKPATTALKHGLISVTIKCPDNSGEKELTKKLPKTMTVQKLKGLLQRLYKVDSSEQKLSYLDNRGDREIELDDDLKQLSFYSIATGDTVLLRW